MDEINIKTKLKIFFFRRKYIKEIEQKIKYSQKDVYTYFKPYNLDDKCTNYRELTIINHRRLWGWIAYNTLKERKKYLKIDYFHYYNIPHSKYPDCFCYLCEYKNRHNQLCVNCLLDWGTDDKYSSICTYSYFQKWYSSMTWIEKYYYADKIANLKERKKENK